MQDIQASLSLIETAAETYLSGRNTRSVKSGISAVKRKMDDNMLYLAVVGEFNSGKSTFINALIGYRLLKEAVMPTTACATYIRKGGKQTKVNVRFFDGNAFRCTESSLRYLQNYLLKTHQRKADTMRDVIVTITSDQQVARTVKSLEIDLPDANIPDNVVIIDTPGFNPGAQSVDNHPEVTRRVVEDVADAALVLTPREQAMSATLINFLSETLQRCLHRCFFVVTKMDTGAPADRKEIMQFVRERIKGNLGVKHPDLSGESAITHLPVKRIPPALEQEWSKLQESFSRFEEHLWERLGKVRQTAISEHVVALVSSVAKECAEKLKEKKGELDRSMRFLVENQVENIRIVTEHMEQKVQSAIDEALSKVNVSLATAESNCHAVIPAILAEGIITADTFENQKKGQIATLVNRETKNAMERISQSMNHIVRNCVSEQLRRMSREFASHYNQFPSLRPQLQTPTVDLVRMNLPTMNFSSAAARIKSLEKEEHKSGGIGAAGCAGLGFALGGPVGALLGAGIGYFAGAIAGDKSNEMCADTQRILDDEIKSFFASTSIRIDEEKNRVRQQYRRLIADFAHQHVVEYGQAVDAILARHKKEVDELDGKIRTLAQTTRSLEHMHDDLQADLAYMKNL